jgi:hypothetical protein
VTSFPDDPDIDAAVAAEMERSSKYELFPAILNLRREERR